MVIMQPSELDAGVVHVLFGWFKRHFSPKELKHRITPQVNFFPKFRLKRFGEGRKDKGDAGGSLAWKSCMWKCFVWKSCVWKSCVCVWKSCVLQSCVKGLFMTKPCVCEREGGNVACERVRESCACVCVCVCEGVVCEQVVCERWQTCVCGCVWVYHLKRCKRFGMLFSLQQVSAGGSGPLMSPLPTKLLMSCEDIGADHPDVPAKTLPSDHGTWLTQEPPCRFQ